MHICDARVKMLVIYVYTRKYPHKGKYDTGAVTLTTDCLRKNNDVGSNVIIYQRHNPNKQAT